MAKTYAQLLDELRDIRTANAAMEKKMKANNARRDVVMALAIGFPESRGGVIARAAGVSAAFVSQKAPAKASRAAAKNTVAAKLAAAVGAPPEGAALPGAEAYAGALDAVAKRGPRELPGVGDTPVTVENGAASVRKWTSQRSRLTAVAHPDGRMMVRGNAVRLALRDQSAAAWLDALPSDVERLVITGPRPWHTDRDTTMTHDVNEWLSAPTPGWVPASHFPHERNPVGRWRHTESGRRVEIQHIGGWLVDDDAAPDVVFHAFGMLHRALRQRWGSDSIEVLSSPTTTGQDLWARSIPRDTEYQLMSPELRELIRTTSGQGRFELRTPPNVPATLPGLHYYDATFAYAALTWGMPMGAPHHITGKAFTESPDAVQAKIMRGRGRWHVRATVPAGWDHVGILPCSGVNGREYPSEPGRTFTTWAGGSEVWLAREHGWHVEVLDGITWQEGKPLDLWKNRLVECWTALNTMSATANGRYQDAAKLAAKMTRSILLCTIGGFHSRGVAKAGLAGSESAIPSTATRAEETEAGQWAWKSDRQVSGQFAHPEWSAEIYSRMRARLLSGPNGTGVLAGVSSGSPRIPASHVVAFRADAVYLTHDAEWVNPDEKPGLFRLKGTMGAVAAPMTEGDLMELRDTMEAGK